MSDKPKITRRDGWRGVLCPCGHWQILGAYVFAHTHVDLFNTCKCGREHKLRDMRVTLSKDIKPTTTTKAAP